MVGPGSGWLSGGWRADAAVPALGWIRRGSGINGAMGMEQARHGR